MNVQISFLRKWPTIVAISSLILLHLYPYAYSAAVSDPGSSLSPEWDALIRSGPWAALVAVICRWFMVALDRKDALLVSLIEQYRRENEANNRETIARNLQMDVRVDQNKEMMQQILAHLASEKNR